MKILTFDLEDWFHLIDVDTPQYAATNWCALQSRLGLNVDRILSALDDCRHDQDATWFCLGWVARQHPQIIKKLSEEGFEIGCHSDLHIPVSSMSPSAFRDDLRRAVGSISEITGKRVTSYRAPGFSIGRNEVWALEILADEGLEFDASIFVGNHSHGGLPNFPSVKPITLDLGDGKQIKEFPMTGVPLLGGNFIFSGGGYFRLLPTLAILSCFANSDYVMTYFHPRDFDSRQPIMQGLSRLRRFKSYVGLSTSEAKFRRILDEFKFNSLSTAVKKINWGPTVDLQVK